MTQAFVYVDYATFLGIPNAYDIRGNVLKLIDTYFKKRKQYTQILKIHNETKMEKYTDLKSRIIQYGEPQDGVLGPLLFILYINDLPNATKNQITFFFFFFF